MSVSSADASYSLLKNQYVYLYRESRLVPFVRNEISLNVDILSQTIWISSKELDELLKPLEKYVSTG